MSTKPCDECGHLKSNHGYWTNKGEFRSKVCPTKIMGGTRRCLCPQYKEPSKEKVRILLTITHKGGTTS